MKSEPKECCMYMIGIDIGKRYHETTILGNMGNWKIPALF